jgi:hypothetical protein
MRLLIAAGILAVLATACGAPGAPPPPPPPPDPGQQTAPIIRAITVPSARVEAGVDIALTATVEDAETPLTQLTYQWAASAGTITGSGTTATWTMPRGITAGVDVVITLTVIDTYNALLNGQIVQRQFTVLGTSTPFRVHDSEAEPKELARKFLVDLFGNSSVSADACMVDFSDVCANLGEGKIGELAQIKQHRAEYVVVSRRMLNQRVDVFPSNVNFRSVHTAMEYVDRKISTNESGGTCGDFEVTVVYVDGRWWICESHYNEEDTSFCPGSANTGGVARVMGGKGKGPVRIPVIRK